MQPKDDSGAAKEWKIRKGYVDVPEGQLHFRSCGDGVPSVLFLHASAQSSAMFNAVLPRVADQGLAAVAIDLPNSGESYATDPFIGLDDIVASVVAASQQLEFSLPFSVVGHEAGAALAIHLAVAFPKLIAKVVLWGMPLLGFMERGDRLREDPPDYEDEFEEVIQTFIAERYPDESTPWKLKVRGLIEMLQTYDRKSLTAIALASIDCQAVLHEVEQPVLSLTGDNEPFSKTTARASMIVKNGKLGHMGPAGRDVADEFPEEYATRIADFLHVPGPQPLNVRWTLQAEKVLRSVKDLKRAGSSDLHRRLSDVGILEVYSPTTPLDDRGISRTSTETDMDFSKDERKSIESERRFSGDRKKLTIRGLLKGKFSAH